ncbi:unnamed protein product [Rotaria sp. Silwood1]|nr:unnamed protein product [Rotaria sp. Silwood1]CAF3905701.1 unnamed protein product [Rotaria sp. Silwood1]CAF4798250.1 unnamed protein product [Rotaria sp. Silwood1]CAF4891616.1 unnamed protein product [Rotaria sp. Silwood1]CAF5079434.1 unnamed protein product [Rotaria sp. Silwood1]
MRAATEPKMSVPMKNMPLDRSLPIINGPPISVSSIDPDRTSLISRVLNANGRQVATTGRVFWACDNTGYSSCSASVISSNSSDLIVTAAHCVFDTTTLRWLINCNWIFVPAYSNGNAPYGRWPARETAALTAWTRSKPDYNYDVAFVALSPVNGRHIVQVTGSQSLGFNQPRSQTTYAFGYPVNIGNGQTLQSCSGIPAASQYTLNGYKGQGLSNCGMGGGCSGGPWLQQFNTATGVGTPDNSAIPFYDRVFCGDVEGLAIFRSVEIDLVQLGGSAKCETTEMHTSPIQSPQ